MTQNKAVGAGGIGGALGVLVVMFMPENWHTFSAEQAAVATMAFGVIFSWLVRFLPQPPR